MLSGWELIIVLLAGVAILVWGPSKIPELARGLGRAKGEFDKASREYAFNAPKSERDTEVSNDDMLILIAKGLGISTQGKTKDKIFQEIIENIKAGKTAS